MTNTVKKYVKSSHPSIHPYPEHLLSQTATSALALEAASHSLKTVELQWLEH